MRFSSDTIPIGPDLGQICGVGIKLFGVPGKKVEEKSALTQDFLLQNIDRFFVKNVQELCEDSIDDEKFRREHPATDEILKKMDHRVGSVLHVPYWSCLPSRFGSDMYAKYKLEPHDAIDRPPKKAASGYLKNDLTRRLAADEARFGFYLQLFKDNARTPLDDGTAVWSERVSPPLRWPRSFFQLKISKRAGRPSTLTTWRSPRGIRFRSTNPTATSKRYAGRSIHVGDGTPLDEWGSERRAERAARRNTAGPSPVERP